MARNNRDRLIRTFQNMNRTDRRAPKPPRLNVTTPNIRGASTSYRPRKRSY